MILVSNVAVSYGELFNVAVSYGELSKAAPYGELPAVNIECHYDVLYIALSSTNLFSYAHK